MMESWGHLKQHLWTQDWEDTIRVLTSSVSRKGISMEPDAIADLWRLLKIWIRKHVFQNRKCYENRSRCRIVMVEFYCCFVSLFCVFLCGFYLFVWVKYKETSGIPGPFPETETDTLAIQHWITCRVQTFSRILPKENIVYIISWQQCVQIRNRLVVRFLTEPELQFL